MILTRVHPAPVESLGTGDAGFGNRLSALYRPDRPDWLRLNMIGSVNGSATGRDGTSESLSSRTDRRILGAIRDLSDVVLVGASSVRVEGYVLPRTASLAIVTRTGDLSGARLARGSPRGELLILCPSTAVDTVRAGLGTLDARIVPLDTPHDDIEAPTIVAALHAEGLRSIVCEGGPTLASYLLAAAIVDELCLSTSPTLVSPGLGLIAPPLPVDTELRLTQLLVDEQGAIYSRWSVPGRAATR